MSGTVIVDYGSGNLHSARKAFEKAVEQSGRNDPLAVSDDPDIVAKADHIVLPGVGAFADCRAGLDRIDGMVDALHEAVRTRARPFLGICVGAQLLADTGHEKVATPGLGWIGGDVRAIEPADPALAVPHMGWNTLDARSDHAVLSGIPTGADGWHAYFVHSYHLRACDPETLIATSDYGGPVTAIVGRDNVVGTQFHPEKSQALGLRLIANFLSWTP